MSTAMMTTGAGGFGSFGAPAIRPRLRLTKRGRAVLFFLAATPLVIAALFIALNGGQASASLDGSSTAFQYVTVDEGESLWQVAQEIAPAADPRDVIQQLMQLNQLDSADVFAGVQLAIPAQYTK
jgi:hypothetical protein